MKTTFLKFIGIMTLPLSLSVSCWGSSSSSKNTQVILVGKTQIDKLGKVFAKEFDNLNTYQVENGPEKTLFETKNGDQMITYLATQFGTSSFPGAVTLTNPKNINQYIDKNAFLAFDDPYKKKSDGTIEVDQELEKKNAEIAGTKINELIKKIHERGQEKQFAKKGAKIYGIPTFVETIGTIFNKTLFKKQGIDIDHSAGAIPTEVQVNAASESSPVKIDPKKMTKNLWQSVMKKINTNDHKAKGIVLKGGQSWALTSKVASAAIAAAAVKHGLKHIGFSLETNSDQNVLTPESARDKLFNDVNSWGVKIMAEAVQNYATPSSLSASIPPAKVYPDNNKMMDGFLAGQILTMPQGSWVQDYLTKEGNNEKNYEFGFLPLNFEGGYNKVATDAVGQWFFSNQAVSSKRDAKQAVAYQKEAVNFVHAFYLEANGKKTLNNKMQLLNPYAENNFENVSKNMLLNSAAKYGSKNALFWGTNFIAPGTGAQGYERNNSEWTTLLLHYQEGKKTLDDVKNKIVAIWAKK